MVFLTKNESGLFRPFNLNAFLDSFFYDWPTADTKPPMTARPVYEGKALKGTEIQIAAAGYKMEDFKIWTEEDKLWISGDNCNNPEVADRFKCAFTKKLVVQKSLDIALAEVKFQNGLLCVFLPLKEERKSAKNYLLGNPE